MDFYLSLRYTIGMSEKQKPYIEKTVVVEEKYTEYNPKYGDDRVCKCGHPYYRHFDTYDHMFPCGCKYCTCFRFVETTGEWDYDNDF